MAKPLPLIDPDCPTSARSATADTLRFFAYFNVAMSAVAAFAIWAAFAQTPVTYLGERTGLTETNWLYVVLCIALVMQGVFGFVILHVIASVSEAVTGIRISSKAAAEVLSKSAAPIQH